MPDMLLIDGLNYYRRRLESPHYGTSTARAVYQYAAIQGATQIWVWDGPGNNTKRRAIYPDYKMQRKPASEDIFAGIGFLRDVLKHSGVSQVCVPGYEGDDVIATLARYLSSKNIPSRIFSNDWDYTQLTTDPLITLEYPARKPVPPQYIRLYKTLVGDPSDNIPGLRLFGEKAWESYEASFRDQVIRALEARSKMELVSLNWQPKHHTQVLADPQRLIDFYQITGFLEVPQDLIEKHWQWGVYDPLKAEDMFKEFLL